MLTASAEVGFQPGEVSGGPAERMTRIPDTDAPSIDVLVLFAARTYAPATEASRLSGAGAGTTDND